MGAEWKALEPLAHQVAQLTPDPVAHDSAPDGPAHDEPDLRRGRLTRRVEVDDKRGNGGANALPDGSGEGGACTHACRGRQHGRPARQAESRARPLRRRLARMARPARVRMRRRNPWVFARRRLFGWNVRLLTEELPTQGPARLVVAAGKISSGRLAPPAGGCDYGTGGPGPGSNRSPPRLARTPSRRHAEHRPQIRRGLWRTACCRCPAAVSVRATGSSPAVHCGGARLSCSSVKSCHGPASSWPAMARSHDPQSVDAHVDDAR